MMLFKVLVLLRFQPKLRLENRMLWPTRLGRRLHTTMFSWKQWLNGFSLRRKLRSLVCKREPLPLPPKKTNHTIRNDFVTIISWTYDIFFFGLDPYLGKIPILTIIFFKWVVQPPTRYINIHISVNIYIYNIFISTYTNTFIPGTPMTSIFEGQPPKNKVFSNKNKGHLGSRYIYI